MSAVEALLRGLRSAGLTAGDPLDRRRAAPGPAHTDRPARESPAARRTGASSTGSALVRRRTGRTAGRRDRLATRSGSTAPGTAPGGSAPGPAWPSAAGVARAVPRRRRRHPDDDRLLPARCRRTSPAGGSSATSSSSSPTPRPRRTRAGASTPATAAPPRRCSTGRRSSSPATPRWPTPGSSPSVRRRSDELERARRDRRAARPRERHGAAAPRRPPGPRLGRGPAASGWRPATLLAHETVPSLRLALPPGHHRARRQPLPVLGAGIASGRRVPTSASTCSPAAPSSAGTPSRPTPRAWSPTPTAGSSANPATASPPSSSACCGGWPPSTATARRPVDRHRRPQGRVRAARRAARPHRGPPRARRHHPHQPARALPARGRTPETRVLRRAEMFTALAATVLDRPLTQLEDAAVFAAVEQLVGGQASSRPSPTPRPARRTRRRAWQQPCGDRPMPSPTTSGAFATRSTSCCPGRCAACSTGPPR